MAQLVDEIFFQQELKKRKKQIFITNIPTKKKHFLLWIQCVGKLLIQSNDDAKWNEQEKKANSSQNKYNGSTYNYRDNVIIITIIGSYSHFTSFCSSFIHSLIIIIESVIYNTILLFNSSCYFVHHHQIMDSNK